MNFCIAILLTIFRTVIIPIQFQEREFTCSEQDIRSTISSAESYLDTQFRGTITFNIDLAPTVTLDHPASYYGRNGELEHDYLIHEALISACKASSDTDFSLYDNDSDGAVDVVILLAAGLSEADGAGEDEIWPSYKFLENRALPLILNGKRINAFAVTTELKSTYGLNPRPNGPGDICHEICHVFNLPDFYDVDDIASGGKSAALWKTTSIMDEGNRNNDGNTPPNFNAIEMEILGLGECVELKKGNYVLEPLDKSGLYLKTTGGSEDDYILVEYRRKSGWDEYIGGEGLLAYHINKTKPTYYQKWVDNTINIDPAHQGAEIIVASAHPQSAKDVFFPQKGIKALSLGLQGVDLALMDINLTGDGSVSFRVIEPYSNIQVSSFQDAAILQWETVPDVGGTASFKLEWTDGYDSNGSLEGGKASSATMEGLQPHTDYGYILSIFNDNQEAFYHKGSFTTRNRMAGVPPYINLSGAERNEDGSFVRGTGVPLRVNNLLPGTTVKWYMNGVPVTAGADGRYSLRANGTLKAVLTLPDDTEEIIIKEIVLR